MEKHQRVILYGDNVMLSGVRVNLESAAFFEVITLRANPNNEEKLHALLPDVIIFDIGSIRPLLPWELMQEMPNLLVIGIDPDRDQALVWSGQPAKAISMADLIEVIRRQSYENRKVG